jgi:hypothetical protein
MRENFGCYSSRITIVIQRIEDLLYQSWSNLQTERCYTYCQNNHPMKFYFKPKSIWSTSINKSIGTYAKKTTREDKQIPLFTISPLTKHALHYQFTTTPKKKNKTFPSPNIISDFHSCQACPIVPSTRMGSLIDLPIQVMFRILLSVHTHHYNCSK